MEWMISTTVKTVTVKMGRDIRAPQEFEAQTY